MTPLLFFLFKVVKRKIGSLSATRRREQESVLPELKKFQARTSQALWTNWQVSTVRFGNKINIFLNVFQQDNFHYSTPILHVSF